MTKLTDTQLILLSHAAQQESSSFLPLPETLTAKGAAAAKSIASLVKRGLGEEREVTAAALTLRQDGDLKFGMFITNAGRQAIGIDDDADAGTANDSSQVATPPVQPAPRATKAAAVLAMLQRPEGATLDELVAATGWLPHTTRAALTGLRKKGHTIAKEKRGDATCYSIKADA